MITNLRLKRFLVSGVFPVFSGLNKVVKKEDDEIFIYCANDILNDNSLAIFKYLVDNHYNEKYKIICGVSNPNVYKHLIDKNIAFIPKSKCVWQYLKSGHVLYSMGKMPIKPTNKQIVINMWHGTPIKKIGKMVSEDNGEEFFFTYLCASSELYADIMAKCFGCPRENVVICGEPKTDRLFEEKIKKDVKTILWAPTFRQSKYLGYEDSSVKDILPYIKQEEWQELNDILKNNNVDMIVKLHPMQDVDVKYITDFSNLHIYTDQMFQAKNMDLYSELAQADGLITDYSSVYLQYLMLNRPICFAMPDYDEYAKSRGFVFDNPLEYMPGVRALSKNDIYNFIRDINMGKDEYYGERCRVNKLVNYYNDGNNCQRILELSNIRL
ncbi:CDP-glycerol glycerophosphotransferase family protein [Butyrivibrio sp.]|uniref:CDP-glycerol glycerophosphotransferase family protein n=1 Tax=Butyrivibrio sp. TaxID=28121 RepID=UPI0025C138B6|nr:CDP-glycerol glycerophosphotransferase family protein [Butyrivibrio sp.]